MKQIFTFILLASLVIVATNKVQAQTNVSALILSDQIWDISGSPYLINQNTYIDTNASVKIMPGVEVLSQSNTITLQVDGELQALGTEDSTILFDQLQIQLNSSAKSYNNVDGSGAYFNHCVFTTPGIGKRVIQSMYTGLRVENSIFLNTYYSIYVLGGSMNPRKVEIINCTFNDSTGTSFPISTSSTKHDLVMTGNTFNNFAKGGGMIIYASDLYMANNTVNGQSRVTISAISSTITCNEFKNLRAGIEVNVYAADTVNNFVFTHNTIDSCGSVFTNDGMLKVNKYSNYNLNSSRVNNNNFLTNTGTNEKVILSTSNPSPTSYEMMDLKNNYWVSTDSATIESYIRDYSDDINIFGRADFSGFLPDQDTTCEDMPESSCQASFYLAVDTSNPYTLYIVNNSTGTSDATNYLWTFGDGAESYDKNPEHYYAEFGKYKVCLAIYNAMENCYSTYCDSAGLDSDGNLLKQDGFNLVVLDEGELSSSIHDKNLFRNARVYPNPSRGMLSIEIPQLASRNMEISLVDITGRKVYEEHVLNKHTNTVNLSTLQDGMYILHLRSGNEKFTSKIMISR